MRIGLFTHSTNPRGGVVHALSLADALTGLGHDVAVIAPDATGAGFFRRSRAHQLTIEATAHRDLPTLVEHRIDEIAAFVETHPRLAFDIWHAQCSITANALARLQACNRIAAFVRTVHHLDAWTDPRLDDWQTAGVRRAERLFTVSHHVRDVLRRRFGRRSFCIGNGVDRSRFTPDRDQTDAILTTRLGLSDPDRHRPIFLTVGGIEARKNTSSILRAFLRLRASHPDARLIVAGGASLLDHSEALATFLSLRDQHQAADAVILAGIIPDAEMAALYRLADALVFTSLQEGFGLCPLEAMASSTPVIVSATAPFTEHFDPDDCLWADPKDIASIETAMRAALDPPTAARLSASGPTTASRFAWPEIARRHLEVYQARSLAHA